MTPAPLTQAELGALPKLSVYVDETGDRGVSNASSPFFAMTALLVPAEDDWTVKVAAGGLRAMIHVSNPDTTRPLHWKEHFRKKHEHRRQRAAVTLAAMPSAKVVHVVVPKVAVRNYPGMADKDRFYNYTTRLLLERVAYAAYGWPGGARLAIVRLGAVKNMDHKDTLKYLNYVRSGAVYTPWTVPWAYIRWPVTWTGTDWDGVQLADIHAGLLNVALTGDASDGRCAENLLLCKHQLYRSPRGALLGYGVKVMGSPAFITQRCWWSKWSVQ
ncbi:DUF3800 domain-containing protein [Streptomyces tagetis]|uniref:DUF3800 domain-containing protein n=1 Tax=Streptomyces tagetis TaxID=2820809 RepID=A0A941B176_9ACTN|nr:DUF3800 domain-containing protein [Streptomyces sp. RG38]MBQ0827696.1 DUF3800 domain-containing protein [Streptomyces sp. RG38]